ncbi:Peroxiredoxin [Singulisphaera sp. GP187]|uniref:peroxiredoxin family protein n=1 Tax=Singulisphaera sp. GP187 TaxID=1882752 RepID=UPI000927A439|nr:redoxin domain-containing protein [Singulisphaera sp. GP187]SIN79354.1 Peroxiredoxin [Singulisphaera sp. GP187]
MRLSRARLAVKRAMVAVAVLSITPAVGHSRGQEISSLPAQIAAAQERHQRAVERYRQERPAAVRAAARACYEEERRRDLGDLLDRAERFPDDPAAVQAIQFVITADLVGSIGVLNRAVDLLARDHVRHPGIGSYCQFLSLTYHAASVETFIRAVLAKHPDRKDRAGACLALAEMLQIKAHMARHLRKYPEQIKSYGEDHGAEAMARFLRETAPDAIEKEAEAVFERVVNEFGGLRATQPPRSFGEIAAGELNALRHLHIGQVAPDIEGADIEGKRFKLSDFRGKVVLLVYSGEWYPECTEMYAVQRALLARYAGQPFAVVDVNTDQRPDKLRASIEAGRVTWRCWWDGGPGGPIATHWAIRNYPGVFILDAKGIIRHRDVRGEGIDEAVGELMAKAKE